MGELHELSRIFEVLGPKYPALLFPKVRDLLSGPDSASLESANVGNSIRARNVQFELFIMAEFSAAGFPLSDDTLTDVRSIHDGVPVLVECKRPQRDSSIHANLKDAFYQLNDQPRNQLPEALKIAALSLTKVLTDEVGVIGAPSGRSAGNFVSDWIEKKIGPHLQYAQRKGGSNFGGMLIYASLSAIQGDTGNPAIVMKHVFFDNPAGSQETIKAALSWFRRFSAGEHPGVTLI